MEFAHIPVMPEETIKCLDIARGGTYVDGTLGGGGHSELILRSGVKALYGLDRDTDAIAHARRRLAGYSEFTAIHANFHDVISILSELNIAHINGALLDLGVSSYQLDNPMRGFSYHADAPLDMRMDAGHALTAAQFLNTCSYDELRRILWEYGEEKWAANIARVIIDRRPVETTFQLIECIDRAIPKKIRARDSSHPARRTFQAIRIYINDELAPLERTLKDFVEILAPGGRLCVISFHSLEDRIVKRTFLNFERPCTCPPKSPVCVCGNKPKGFRPFRKGITPTPEEVAENPRARSATLRVFQRGDDDG